MLCFDILGLIADELDITSIINLYCVNKATQEALTPHINAINFLHQNYEIGVMQYNYIDCMIDMGYNNKIYELKKTVRDFNNFVDKFDIYIYNVMLNLIGKYDDKKNIEFNMPPKINGQSVKIRISITEKKRDAVEDIIIFENTGGCGYKTNIKLLGRYLRYIKSFLMQLKAKGFGIAKKINKNAETIWGFNNVIKLNNIKMKKIIRELTYEKFFKQENAIIDRDE